MKLEQRPPEQAGILRERLEVADLVIEDAIRKGIIPGAVTLVTSKGYLVWHRAFGMIDPDEGRPARLDTIFDLASITKPMSAGVSAVALAEDGRLHLEQEARSFFPERKLPHMAGITLRHLLTHTSGIAAWTDLYSRAQKREDVLDGVLSLDPRNPPGRAYEYSCLNYILLCFIIERVTGMGLDRYVAERVHRPLGMEITGFNPPEELRPRIAPTTDVTWRKAKICGVVHDQNAAAMGGVSGNAGLFSTAEEVAIFWNMLLYGGAFGGKRVLSSLGAKLMRMPRIDPAIGSQSIGCFMGQNGILHRGDLLPVETFGHTGYTGTQVVVDPVHEVVSVLLTNRALWDDKDKAPFFVARRCYQNAVASAIIE